MAEVPEATSDAPHAGSSMPEREGTPVHDLTSDDVDDVLHGKAGVDDSNVPEETGLDLLVTARDQDELERDIGQQADQMLTEQADERDRKRLEKTTVHKQRLRGQIKRIDQRLAGPGSSTVKNPLRAEKAHYEAMIKELDTELYQIQARLDDRHKAEAMNDGAGEKDLSGRLPNETRREFLIRTGKITPFSKVSSLKASASLADVMLDAEDEDADLPEDEADTVDAAAAPMSHQHLKRPGFEDEEMTETGFNSDSVTPRHVKRRRVESRKDRSSQVLLSPAGLHDSDEEFRPASGDEDEDLASHVDSATTETETDEFSEESGAQRRGKKKVHKSNVLLEAEVDEQDLAGVDDGNEKVYRKRLQVWSAKRSAARANARKRQPAVDGDIQEEMDSRHDSDIRDECFAPHPTRPDTELGDGLRVAGDIYPSLFDYQKTGVRWMWELFQQKVGGIIGDEMGLGKTIQVISFLAGLHYSKKLEKPVIVVAPATVMKQWVNEFHRWWPPLRVSILHSSGSGMMNTRQESRDEEELEEDIFDGENKHRRSAKHTSAAQRIVDRVTKDGHVLVTTYSGLQTYSDILLPLEWGYAVLDEGHKIRNPNTSITIYAKMIRTHNRLILSGTPMQNNLTELWSLFDFVFPMRLGTLVSFRNQFEIPIKTGGYANASNLQVETAMRCAESLKEAISPYLLQRFKVDVAADLPNKTERVLFCKLTKLQKDAYTAFLSSEDMNSIISGKRQALYGVDILRKICNHPDLVDHKNLTKRMNSDYGNPAKSGKMQVVKALLELWKKDGHKTLLFAQHRIMLDILEKFVSQLDGFKYRRMDGNTSIQERQNLVDEFNTKPDLHVFLLTTKVGGLGVNLTGANRVIIYDPDWNPSTDVQARERAWRLGQKREVEIYRLMTAGTIEEKIYHRQIFKQFLSNKILRDPKQRQTFHLKDLHDLFSFGDSADGSTETGSIFKGTEVKFDDEKKDSIAKLNDDQAEDARRQANNLTSNSDIDAIKGLHHHEKFAGAAEVSKSSATDQNSDEIQDQKSDRLLSTIFAKSGVQSAYDQDAILGTNNQKRKITADPEMIAAEARRVADLAAKELRKAAKVAVNVPAGTPTWTGLVGTTGRPDERPRSFPIRGGISSRGGRGGQNGPSSSSILANLASRQGAGLRNGSPATASSRASTPGSAASTNAAQPKGKEFMVLIRDYLRTQGGSAYTQMLIDHFNRFCGTAERTAEFKEMLRTIADLDKGPRGRGRGRWVLKSEWR